MYSSLAPLISKLDHGVCVASGGAGSDCRRAGLKSLGAGLTAAAGANSGSTWYVKALVNGSAGGITAEIQGGRFGDGFVSGAGFSLASSAFNALAGDSANNRPGTPEYNPVKGLGGQYDGDTFWVDLGDPGANPAAVRSSILEARIKGELGVAWDAATQVGGAVADLAADVGMSVLWTGQVACPICSFEWPRPDIYRPQAPWAGSRGGGIFIYMQ